MAKPRRLVAPSEEALGAGGTTTASAARATRPRVATMNKKYNNPLAISVGQRHQGQDPLEAILHDAPTINLR
jgi:ribose 5-phosphate isomerase RpiB